MTDHKANKDWWRGAIIYQIYPSSYKDTSGNGIGDLNGITQKLDYIAALGVEGVWISPFMKSPMADYGYDVSDYHDVDPKFGTMDDFKTLLDQAHNLGLKVIIDMVLSHTSDEHEWFKQSKMSKTGPKSDWYVWADPKEDGTPPNNWLSIFGGSAWQYYPLRGQYYLHNFLKEQPDLNYHNPDVQDAMLESCRFWLDLGVDGFRLDAVNFCVHDPQLRDNPPNPNPALASQLEFPDAYGMQFHAYSKSQPENLDFMRRIRALMDEYDATFTVAEIGDDHATRTAAAYTADDTMLHTAYSFALMTNKGPVPSAKFFRDVIKEQMAEPGDSWPSWAFSNHDVVRAASRWSGTDYNHDPALSQMLVALLGSLRGTAFLYQGDELGLPEAEIPFEDICDPWGKYLWPKWQGRDGCRTPMPWDSTPEKAGFTDGAQSWLPIPDSHLPLSVEKQELDSHSTLNATRKFLHWRKNQPVLKHGDIAFFEDCKEPILAFERISESQRIVCLFNLSPKAHKIDLNTLNAASEAHITFGNAKVIENGIEQSYEIAPYGYVFLDIK